MYRAKAFTLAELLVVAGIFILMIAALAPVAQLAKARSNRLGCADNLRKISIGLHKYAVDHNDSFPQKLGELYPDYVDSNKVFDCPASKSIGTDGKPDYEYTTGLTEASSPRQIIVADIEGNHKRSGKNILRIDGSVEWGR